MEHEGHVFIENWRWCTENRNYYLFSVPTLFKHSFKRIKQFFKHKVGAKRVQYNFAINTFLISIYVLLNPWNVTKITSNNE